MHSRTDEYLSNKKYKLFIKLMKFATKKGDLFREHKRRNVFLLFFFFLVRYANQLSHNITELVFVFYFHSVLKLQQGVLHNCNKTGLPDFLFCFSIYKSNFLTSKILLQFRCYPCIHRLLPHN